MKIALAQINPTVGDFRGNTAKIVDFTHQAAAAKADLVLFSELAICGYPPADLLEKPSFVARAGEAMQEVATATASLPIAVISGFVTPAENGSGKRVRNSAALLRNGKIEFTQSKMLLPFYDVFDEQRYFAPAERQKPFCLDGEHVALTICEDAWNDKTFWPARLYAVDPVDELMREAGEGPGSLIINISASPYWRNKRKVRFEMLAAIAKRHRVPVIMVNQVGGNDSLIFDGSSLAIGPDGELIARAHAFEEDLIFVDTRTLTGDIRPKDHTQDAGIYEALVLGTRDYVRKCGFSKALVGLSGGIDSALVACIAVDALGKENVRGITMPSQYSSTGSVDDSRILADNLGIRLDRIAIEGLFQSYEQALAPLFAGTKPDLTEENIQSRIRGVLLMAMSNKSGALVLTTGNKSEMSVGYCTLYGDMVGALAVIGDVMKTRVYDLCRYINREREIIPAAILEKPPSAELRPGQKDTDSLPPYEVLDPILEAYVERYETPESHRRRPRLRSRTGPLRRQTGGAQRIQAPAGRASAQSHRKSLRHGPPFSIAVKVQV